MTSRARKWLEETEPTGGEFVRPLLECNDGFSVSVQCSPGHYCSQRRSIPGLDPYVDVEVYQWSETETLLAPYEYGDEPAGWVPVSVIDDIIEKHGGLLSDPMPRATVTATKPPRRKLTLGSN